MTARSIEDRGVARLRARNENVLTVVGEFVRIGNDFESTVTTIFDDALLRLEIDH